MKMFKKMALGMAVVTLFGSLKISAFADDSSSLSQTATTSITTYVPETFDLQLSFDGNNGSIVVDGVRICTSKKGKTDKEDSELYSEELEIEGESMTIQVALLTEQTYHFIPDKGCQLVKLTYNGVDVTNQVQNNSFTAPAMTGNGVLVASFAEKGSDDSSQLSSAVASNIRTWFTGNMRSVLRK